MATVTPARVALPDIRGLTIKWLGFAASGDVGTSVDMPAYPDRSVQVLGNFGSAGEVTIQGSNDGGTTWATLTDPQGNALVFTSARLEAITELVGKIRPAATAGSGAAIDVYIFFGGSRL